MVEIQTFRPLKGFFKNFFLFWRGNFLLWLKSPRVETTSWNIQRKVLASSFSGHEFCFGIRYMSEVSFMIRKAWVTLRLHYISESFPFHDPSWVQLSIKNPKVQRLGTKGPSEIILFSALILQMMNLRPRECAFYLLTQPLSGASPTLKALSGRREFHSKFGTWIRFIVVRSKQSKWILGLKVWKDLGAKGNKLAPMVSPQVIDLPLEPLTKQRTPVGPTSSNSGFQPWDYRHFGPNTSLLWGLSCIFCCCVLFWFGFLSCVF